MTTKLRREMDNAMVLRGFALRTREAYLACVTALAQHYHRSPDPGPLPYNPHSLRLRGGSVQRGLSDAMQHRAFASASPRRQINAFR